MYCFCFLAYGDEHIDEFNIVAKSLLKLNPEYKIIVGTDSEDKIIDGVYKIIKIDEPFNYNLKRIVIKEAFVDFNTLILWTFIMCADIKFTPAILNSHLCTHNIFSIEFLQRKAGNINLMMMSVWKKDIRDIIVNNIGNMLYTTLLNEEVEISNNTKMTLLDMSLYCNTFYDMLKDNKIESNQISLVFNEINNFIQTLNECPLIENIIKLKLYYDEKISEQDIFLFAAYDQTEKTDEKLKNDLQKEFKNKNIILDNTSITFNNLKEFDLVIVLTDHDYINWKKILKNFISFLARCSFYFF